MNNKDTDLTTPQAGLLYYYSKTCIKQSLSKRPKIGFQDQLSLNAVQKYCRMLKGSILQYFRPSLSYHLSLRSLFCLFFSGRFTQVLLYINLHERYRPAHESPPLNMHAIVSSGQEVWIMVCLHLHPYFVHVSSEERQAWERPRLAWAFVPQKCCKYQNLKCRPRGYKTFFMHNWTHKKI